MCPLLRNSLLRNVKPGPIRAIVIIVSAPVANYATNFKTTKVSHRYAEESNRYGNENYFQLAFPRKKKTLWKAETVKSSICDQNKQFEMN